MIEIYGTPSCPNCKLAQNLLRLSGREFLYKEISTDTGITKEDMLERIPEEVRSSIRSVPQIFAEGEYIGGLKDLEYYLEV